jgi:phenylacetaldehyde dehydrogenase
MATFATPPVTQAHPGIDPRLGKDAAAFAGSKHQMYIDGAFVSASSGKTFPVFNPATGEIICQVPEGDHVDVDKAVHAARRAFDSGPWHTISPSARGQLLWKLADLLEQHTDEFAELESLDNGSPPAPTSSATPCASPSASSPRSSPGTSRS